MLIAAHAGYKVITLYVPYEISTSSLPLARCRNPATLLRSLSYAACHPSAHHGAQAWPPQVVLVGQIIGSAQLPNVYSLAEEKLSNRCTPSQSREKLCRNTLADLLQAILNRPKVVLFEAALYYLVSSSLAPDN